MEVLQLILVYITLAIAVGYIVKKFFLPKTDKMIVGVTKSKIK